MQTLPILLAGTMAMSLNMAAPLGVQTAPGTDQPDGAHLQRRNIQAQSLRTAVQKHAVQETPVAKSPTTPVIGSLVVTAVAPAPATYRVESGDTVSSIAASYGLSTSSVLALNGLGWNSLIFPGQILQLVETAATPPATITPVTATAATTPMQAEYTISSGDTITAIASRFGVSTQSVLEANGLGWSTIIYPGQSIVIPGQSSVASDITELTEEMAANARTIISVGTSLGVSDYGLIIALAAAMQESSLRNLDYGDLDSLGLFQQRPSTGWGSPAQVTDTEHASRLFFGGPSNPNHGITRGLLDIPGWQSMTVTDAAQAVQVSAYPDAYAKWEASATLWLAQLR